MLRLKTIFACFVLLALDPVGLVSQDIHYSQFFNSPLNLSPALTGIFNGDVRAHANYKDQWSTVPVGYTSGDVGLDIKRRVGRKNNFLGLGALINYDQAGDLGLGWTGANLLGSYSIKTGEHGYLTPGVSLGYYSRNFDNSKAATGNQWNGKGIDPAAGPEIVGNESINFAEIGLGLNFRRQKSYRKHTDLGVSLLHINSPTQQFFINRTDYSAARPMKLSLYGMSNLPLASKLDLLLNALYSTQESYQELVLNAQGKIYLSAAQNKALYLGIGLRTGDAWYPMIALQWGQLYGAFSYDMNFSEWDVATDGRGGPELSLRYIWAKVPDLAYKPCLIY